MYLNNYESRIDIAYIYERLHDALDGDDLAQEISDLKSELAHNFEIDTNVKIGVALGWNKDEKTQPKSFRGILYDSKADLLAGIIAEWNSGLVSLWNVATAMNLLGWSPEKEADHIIDYFCDSPESRDWLAEFGLTHDDLIREITSRSDAA